MDGYGVGSSVLSIMMEMKHVGNNPRLVQKLMPQSTVEAVLVVSTMRWRR